VTILDPRRLFGQEGESTAEQYLRHKGYRIVARNLRSSVGEMDLVAEDGQVLVFVEVKARRTNAFGGAIHAVHQRKQKKLIRLASQYLARHHVEGRLCRFDVVLLQGTDAVARRSSIFRTPSKCLETISVGRRR
jgi:putative endonuclease